MMSKVSKDNSECDCKDHDHDHPKCTTSCVCHNNG